MTDKLRILARDYKLVYDDPLSHNEFLMGEIDHHRQTIRLLRSMTPQHQHITLWHEALHGVFFQLGLNDENQNEQLIDTLSTAIAQILRDNPIMRQSQDEVRHAFK